MRFATRVLTEKVADKKIVVKKGVVCKAHRWLLTQISDNLNLPAILLTLGYLLKDLCESHITPAGLTDYLMLSTIILVIIIFVLKEFVMGSYYSWHRALYGFLVRMSLLLMRFNVKLFELCYKLFTFDILDYGMFLVSLLGVIIYGSTGLINLILVLSSTGPCIVLLNKLLQYSNCTKTTVKKFHENVVIIEPYNGGHRFRYDRNIWTTKHQLSETERKEHTWFSMPLHKFIKGTNILLGDRGCGVVNMKVLNTSHAPFVYGPRTMQLVGKSGLPLMTTELFHGAFSGFDKRVPMIVGIFFYLLFGWIAALLAVLWCPVQRISNEDTCKRPINQLPKLKKSKMVIGDRLVVDMIEWTKMNSKLYRVIQQKQYQGYLRILRREKLSGNLFKCSAKIRLTTAVFTMLFCVVASQVVDMPIPVDNSQLYLGICAVSVLLAALVMFYFFPQMVLQMCFIGLCIIIVGILNGRGIVFVPAWLIRVGYYAIVLASLFTDRMRKNVVITIGLGLLFAVYEMTWTIIVLLIYINVRLAAGTIMDLVRLIHVFFRINLARRLHDTVFVDFLYFLGCKLPLSLSYYNGHVVRSSDETGLIYQYGTNDRVRVMKYTACPQCGVLGHNFKGKIDCLRGTAPDVAELQSFLSEKRVYVSIGYTVSRVTEYAYDTVNLELERRQTEMQKLQTQLDTQKLEIQELRTQRETAKQQVANLQTQNSFLSGQLINNQKDFTTYHNLYRQSNQVLGDAVFLAQTKRFIDPVGSVTQSVASSRHTVKTEQYEPSVDGLSQTKETYEERYQDFVRRQNVGRPLTPSSVGSSRGRQVDVRQHQWKDCMERVVPYRVANQAQVHQANVSDEEEELSVAEVTVPKVVSGNVENCITGLTIDETKFVKDTVRSIWQETLPLETMTFRRGKPPPFNARGEDADIVVLQEEIQQLTDQLEIVNAAKVEDVQVQTTKHDQGPEATKGDAAGDLDYAKPAVPPKVEDEDEDEDTDDSDFDDTKVTALDENIITLVSKVTDEDIQSDLVDPVCEVATPEVQVTPNEEEEDGAVSVAEVKSKPSVEERKTATQMRKLLIKAKQQDQKTNAKQQARQLLLDKGLKKGSVIKDSVPMRTRRDSVAEIVAQHVPLKVVGGKTHITYDPTNEEQMADAIFKEKHPNVKPATYWKRYETSSLVKELRQDEDYMDESFRFVDTEWKTEQVLKNQVVNIPGLTVECTYGNIFDSKAKVIVNPANSNLQHGSGLARQIALKAGDALAKRDFEIMKQGQISIGCCVHSDPGRLGFETVLHVVGPRYKQGDEVLCFKQLVRTNYAALYYTFQYLRLPSLVLPSISTGVFGVPEKIAATAFAVAMHLYAKRYPNQGKVEICNSEIKKHSSFVFALMHLRRPTSRDVFDFAGATPLNSVLMFRGKVNINLENLAKLHAVGIQTALPELVVADYGKEKVGDMKFIVDEKTDVMSFIANLPFIAGRIAVQGDLKMFIRFMEETFTLVTGQLTDKAEDYAAPVSMVNQLIPEIRKRDIELQEMNAAVRDEKYRNRNFRRYANVETNSSQGDQEIRSEASFRSDSQVEIPKKQRGQRRAAAFRTKSMHNVVMVSICLISFISLAMAAEDKNLVKLVEKIADQLIDGKVDCLYCRSTSDGCYEQYEFLDIALQRIGQQDLLPKDKCACMEFCDCDYVAKEAHCDKCTEEELFEELAEEYISYQKTALANILRNTPLRQQLELVYEPSDEGLCKIRRDALEGICVHKFLNVEQYQCGRFVFAKYTTDKRMDAFLKNCKKLDGSVVDVTQKVVQLVQEPVMVEIEGQIEETIELVNEQVQMVLESKTEPESIIEPQRFYAEYVEEPIMTKLQFKNELQNFPNVNQRLYCLFRLDTMYAYYENGVKFSCDVFIDEYIQLILPNIDRNLYNLLSRYFNNERFELRLDIVHVPSFEDFVDQLTLFGLRAFGSSCEGIQVTDKYTTCPFRIIVHEDTKYLDGENPFLELTSEFIQEKEEEKELPASEQRVKLGFSKERIQQPLQIDYVKETTLVEAKVEEQNETVNESLNFQANDSMQVDEAVKDEPTDFFAELFGAMKEQVQEVTDSVAQKFGNFYQEGQGYYQKLQQSFSGEILNVPERIDVGDKNATQLSWFAGNKCQRILALWSEEYRIDVQKFEDVCAKDRVLLFGDFQAALKLADLLVVNGIFEHKQVNKFLKFDIPVSTVAVSLMEQVDTHFNCQKYGIKAVNHYTIVQEVGSCYGRKWLQPFVIEVYSEGMEVQTALLEKIYTPKECHASVVDVPIVYQGFIQEACEQGFFGKEERTQITILVMSYKGKFNDKYRYERSAEYKYSAYILEVAKILNSDYGNYVTLYLKFSKERLSKDFVKPWPLHLHGQHQEGTIRLSPNTLGEHTLISDKSFECSMDTKLDFSGKIVSDGKVHTLTFGSSSRECHDGSYIAYKIKNAVSSLVMQTRLRYNSIYMIAYYAMGLTITVVFVNIVFSLKPKNLPSVFAGVSFYLLCNILVTLMDFYEYFEIVSAVVLLLKCMNAVVVLFVPFTLFSYYIIAIEGAYLIVYMVANEEAFNYFVLYVIILMFSLFKNAAYIEIPMPKFMYDLLDLPLLSRFQKPWRVKRSYGFKDVSELLRYYNISYSDMNNLLNDINSTSTTDDEKKRAAFFLRLVRWNMAPTASGVLAYDPDRSLGVDMAKLESRTVNANLRIPMIVYKLSPLNLLNNCFQIIFKNSTQFCYQIEPGKILVNRHMFACGATLTEEGFAVLHAKMVGELSSIKLGKVEPGKRYVELPASVEVIYPYTKRAEMWAFKVKGLPQPTQTEIYQGSKGQWVQICMYTPDVEDCWIYGNMLPDGRIVTNTEPGYCGSPVFTYDEGYRLIGFHNSSAKTYISILDPITYRPIDTDETTDVVSSSQSVRPVNNPLVYVAGLLLSGKVKQKEITYEDLKLLIGDTVDKYGFGEFDVDEFIKEFVSLTHYTMADTVKYLGGLLDLNDKAINSIANFQVQNMYLSEFSKLYSMKHLVNNMLKVSMRTESGEVVQYTWLNEFNLKFFMESFIFVIMFITCFGSISYPLFFGLGVVPFILYRIQRVTLRQQLVGTVYTFLNVFILQILTSRGSVVYRILTNLDFSVQNIIHIIFEGDMLYLLTASAMFLFVFFCLVNFSRNRYKIFTLSIGLFVYFAGTGMLLETLYFVCMGPFELMTFGFIRPFLRQVEFTSLFMYLIYLYAIGMKLIFATFFGKVYLFGRWVQLVDAKSERVTLLTLINPSCWSSMHLETSVATVDFLTKLLNSLNIIAINYVDKIGADVIRKAQLAAVEGTPEMKLKAIFEYVENFRQRIPSFAEVMDGQQDMLDFVKVILKSNLEAKQMDCFINQEIVDLYMANLLLKASKKMKIKDILLGIGEFAGFHKELAKFVSIDIDAFVHLRTKIPDMGLDKAEIDAAYLFIKDSIAALMRQRGAILAQRYKSMDLVRDDAARLYLMTNLKRADGLLDDKQLESFLFYPMLVAGEYVASNFIDIYYESNYKGTIDIKQLEPHMQLIIKILFLVNDVVSLRFMQLESSTELQNQKSQLDQLQYHINELLEGLDSLSGMERKERNRLISDLQKKYADIQRLYNKQLSDLDQQDAINKKQQKKAAIIFQQEETERRKKIEEQHQMELFIGKLIKYMSALAKLKDVSIPNVLAQFDAMVDGGASVELWSAIFDATNMSIQPTDMLAYNRDESIVTSIKKEDYADVSFWKYRVQDSDGQEKQFAVYVGGGSRRANIPPWYYVLSFNGEDEPEKIYKRLQQQEEGELHLCRYLSMIPESVEIKDNELTVKQSFPAMSLTMGCGYEINCDHPGTLHTPISIPCRRSLMNQLEKHVLDCRDCLTEFMTKVRYRCGQVEHNVDKFKYYVHAMTCKKCKPCTLESCSACPRAVAEGVCIGVGYHGESHPPCLNKDCKMDHESFVSTRSTKYTSGKIEKIGNEYVITINGQEAGKVSQQSQIYKNMLEPSQYKLNIPNGYKIWLDERFSSVDNFSRVFMLLYRYFNAQPKAECRICNVNVESELRHLADDQTRQHSVVFNNRQYHNFTEALYHESASLKELQSYQEVTKPQYTAADCIFAGISEHKAFCKLCTSLVPLTVPNLVDPLKGRLYLGLLSKAQGKNKCQNCGAYKPFEKCIFCKPIKLEVYNSSVQQFKNTVDVSNNDTHLLGLNVGCQGNM